MKILLVNIHGYLSYGSESYFSNFAELLKNKGHDVIIFTSKDKRNIDNTYADYFVDNIDFKNFYKVNLLKRILYASRAIYSFDAKRKIEKLIKITKPDIAHIHNVKYIISPSILHSLKKFCIPIIQTLHDYHLVCPNYRLYYDGRICEACRDKRFYNAILKKCIRNSVAFSTLGCLEHYIHRFLKVFNNVDVFIAPSNFMRQKMIKYGFSSQKIFYIPHFLFLDNYQPKYEFDNYIVYMGRLTREKGVTTLIEAMSSLSSIRLLVIGDGEYRKDLESLVREEKIKNVEFKGYIPKEDIKTIVENAMFVIVPSEWYDNSPMVIYESFLMGKPVIGANIGGIPELIDDGVNGLLCNPGDVSDLTGKITYLFNNKDKILEMAKNARRKALENYSADIHYGKILDVYRKLTINR